MDRKIIVSHLVSVIWWSIFGSPSEFVRFHLLFQDFEFWGFSEKTPKKNQKNPKHLRLKKKPQKNPKKNPKKPEKNPKKTREKPQKNPKEFRFFEKTPKKTQIVDVLLLEKTPNRLGFF